MRSAQGEPGQNLALGPFTDVTKAIAAFEKKFYDKTKNSWENRDKFKTVSHSVCASLLANATACAQNTVGHGKYTLIEVGDDDDEDTGSAPASKAAAKAPASGGAGKHKPSALDASTQALIKMIFDNDMFREAMVEMEIGAHCASLSTSSVRAVCRCEEDAFGQAEQGADRQGLPSARQDQGDIGEGLCGRSH